MNQIMIDMDKKKLQGFIRIKLQKEIMENCENCEKQIKLFKT